MLVVDRAPTGCLFLGAVGNHVPLKLPFLAALIEDLGPNVFGNPFRFAAKGLDCFNLFFCTVGCHVPLSAPFCLTSLECRFEGFAAKFKHSGVFVVSIPAFIHAVFHHIVFRSPFLRAIGLCGVVVVTGRRRKGGVGQGRNSQCGNQNAHGEIPLNSIVLSNAPRRDRVNLQQKKTVVGFDGLSILWRSKTALNMCGFLMSGRNGRPQGLPTPQGRSVNLLLPRHPFDGGSLGSNRTCGDCTMSANQNSIPEQMINELDDAVCRIRGAVHSLSNLSDQVQEANACAMIAEVLEQQATKISAASDGLWQLVKATKS